MAGRRPAGAGVPPAVASLGAMTETAAAGAATEALAEVLIVTERYFYVTHSLNSVQITVAWLPYEEGTYMGVAMSAQADILDTFVARALRPLGRKQAEKMVGEVLITIRDELEGAGSAE